MTFITDRVSESFPLAVILQALNSAYTYNNSKGWSTVGFYLTVPTGGTITFEGSHDDTNWIGIKFISNATGISATTTTLSGNYCGAIIGFSSWRARVSVAGSADGSIQGVAFREISPAVTNTYNNESNPIIISYPASMQSAFGEQLFAQLQPVAQITFPYNLNERLITSTTANGGTVTFSAPFAQINSGTASNGQAILESVRKITYRAGIGVNCRFTAVFQSPDTNSRMIAGIGDANNGLFFGYNGTTFGVLRRSAAADDWIAQTAWNVDKMDGTGASAMILNPAKGNVFQIKFQWLGFGQLSFYIENPETGFFVLVHRYKWANANTNVSLQVPSFPFSIRVTNTGSTTNKTIQVPSIAVQYEGSNDLVGLLNSQVNQISTAGITAYVPTAILAVQNKLSVFGGSNNNRSQVYIKTFSVSNASSKSLRFGLLLDPTSIASATYSDIDANTSVVSYSNNGGTITGGYSIYSTSLAPNGSIDIDLDRLNILLSPGEIIVLYYTTYQNTTGNAEGAMTWGEFIG